MKSKMFQNLLWNSLSLRTTVVNETLLDQNQSRIARKFLKLEIKFIFNSKSHLITILLDVPPIAII